MSVILFLWTNRKIIFAAFLVVLFFSLWFTIERMSDRIDAQQTKIENLTNELANAKKLIQAQNLEVQRVKTYFQQLHNITENEKSNFEKNHETDENCTCRDDIIHRLNELFGKCSEN